MTNNNNIIVGVHPVKEAINGGKEIDKILIQRGLNNPDIKNIAKEFKAQGVPVQEVPKIKLDKLSLINHQGILAFISPITYAEIDDILDISIEKKEPPFILILDGVTDTRNFGAICRTAECMGVHGIIIPKTGSAPVTEGTIKSSAGAIFNLKIARVGHLMDAIHHLKASEISIASCFENASNSLFDFTPSKNGVAIVMGSEEKGIHKKIQDFSDNHIKIDMYGSIESLNVGVATGMILYEVKKKYAKLL